MVSAEILSSIGSTSSNWVSRVLESLKNTYKFDKFLVLVSGAGGSVRLGIFFTANGSRGVTKSVHGNPFRH